MKINIPETGQPRIVIIGGGFAGLTLARKVARQNYQVVLLDKHNYHQFQPLFYQVAMAGLEPSSIVFPFRKAFRSYKNVYIRVTEVTAIEAEHKRVITPLGHCNYDYLVIAIGADTNFFGNERIARLAIPMKSVSEALFLRNTILSDYERALTIPEFEQRQGLVDIVIVGGGPTGVELAGSLAEMRKYILPKDYPELDINEMEIYLIQGADQLLKGMSREASEKALKYLTELGVRVMLNSRVTDFDGEYVHLKDGPPIQARKVIWAAGIIGNKLQGLPDSALTYGNRLKVDRYNRLVDAPDIFAIGDIAYMATPTYPEGHPQVAQVAIQQGRQLAKNFAHLIKNKPLVAFEYRDKGSMATVGRNRAVVDLAAIKFQGWFAWIVWLVVHLFALIGAKNKLFVFLNWVWNYVTYDQSLRLIIRPRVAPATIEELRPVVDGEQESAPPKPAAGA